MISVSTALYSIGIVYVKSDINCRMMRGTTAVIDAGYNGNVMVHSKIKITKSKDRRMYNTYGLEKKKLFWVNDYLFD